MKANCENKPSKMAFPRLDAKNILQIDLEISKISNSISLQKRKNEVTGFIIIKIKVNQITLINNTKHHFHLCH